MLRSQYHEGRAVQRIRTCGIYGDLLITVLHLEIHLSTVRLADPVGLHLLYLLRPVQLVQVVQQAVCVRGDLQHPLTQILLGNRSAAALAAAVDHFLICQTGLTGRTPVDGELLFIRQALFEHLYKNPLGPLIELRICCIHFHIPVVKGCDIVNLSLDISHIFCGRLCRVYAHLDGVILSRKSECVPSHGMNDVMSLHQLVAAPYITDHIASSVTYMKSVA